MATRLRLLGRAKVFDGAEWLDAPNDKRFALLAYLATIGTEVERRHLAFLFWPDVEETRSRRDLRYLIHRTKSLSIASGLRSDSDTLSFQVETDVLSFARALAQRDWGAALNLYGGRFLAGINIDSSAEFMAWVEFERAARHEEWRRAVIARAADLEATMRPDAAADLLKTLVEDDELDEEALRLYLGACVGAGRTDEAIRSYRRFERELECGLGLEPLPATREALAALHGDRSHVNASTERKPEASPPNNAHDGTTRNLPSESTPFIGREQELADIVDLLGQHTCRLLTLVGPGGIGKTRLAQEAALAIAARYGDGVVFVPLAAVESTRWLIPAIAEALSLTFYDQREPLAQLGDSLRDTELLLVLDNLEQLQAAGPVVGELLAACPRLQVLATSREALHLKHEWLLRVEGLPISVPEDPGAAAGGDAVQLFLRCARRVRPDFVLTTEERSDVVRICRLVGGVPLGIELTAGWLDMMSCNEIAQTMSTKGMDFLVSPLHDVPERHRSLRDLFEHSWRLLERSQRTAFASLSVFRGGFTRAAAAAVTGVSVRPLRSLVDRSLVTRNVTGRFYLHELTKQYAAEKLVELGEAEVECRDRHCAHYALYLHERESRLQGGVHQQIAIDEITQEIDNVRSAWQWAVTSHKSEMLELAAGGLRFYFQTRGLYREGERVFSQAAESTVEEGAVRGKLLLFQALFTFWLGRLDESLSLVKLSLACLQHQPIAPGLMVNANFLLGLIQRGLGAYDLARSQFEKALALAVEAGDAYFEARSWQGLGWIAEQRGADAEAEHYYTECLAVLKRSEDRYGLALALFNLGGVLERSGRTVGARECYLEGLAAGRALGSTLRIAEALMLLGRLEMARGEHRLAEDYFKECLAEIEGREDEPFKAVVQQCLSGLEATTAAIRSS